MRFKSQFPKLNFSYLDSASTTQTPGVVLDAMNEYYEKFRANVHRGMYDASIKATEKYEAARADVARFINAKPDEIIFTSGTTASLNQLAYSLSPRLSHRDNIVLTRAEHHANLVPWQQMAKHYGFEIRYIELKNVISNHDSQRGEKSSSLTTTLDSSSPAGSLGMTPELDLTSAARVIDANTKIISLAYISNVLGIINPVEEIIKIARAKNPKVYTIIDGAQAVAHIPVDVQKLDCDFLAFSGHKMYGPTGIGVLYGKKIMLEEHLEPFFFGGEMVKSVSYEKSEWNDIPLRFEAGTPNVAGAIGLGAAVRFIESVERNKIQEHEQMLKNKLFDKLSSLVGVENLLPLHDGADSISIIAFTIPGIHPHDIAEILNQSGVAVRAGFHCAEPLHRSLGLDQGTVRVSLGLHNTEEDIEKLVKGIEKVKKVFK